MQSATLAAPASRGRIWTGRVLTALIALFMLMDAIMHLVQPTPVTEAFARIGVPEHLSVGIGVLALVCVAISLIPRTAVIGTILLTAYLGGATAIQVRAGSTLFEVLFPGILGAILWTGLALRNDRVRALITSRHLTSNGD